SSIGGPAELMIDGMTGLKISGRDERELHDAMLTLMDATLRDRLGRQAREFVEARRVDEPFTAIFDAEAYRRRLPEEQAPDEPGPTSEVVALARMYFADETATLAEKNVA